MGTMKMPHWVAIVAALAIVVVSWLMNQASNGTLVLPAAVLTALTVGKTLLQLFTDNVSGGAGGGGTVVGGKVAPMPGANGPVPPTAARETLRFPVRRSGTFRVLAVAALLGVTGCPAVAPAIDCGSAIAVDAVKGMTIAEIYADVAGRCATDIASVIAALLASKDPAVTSSKAFVEAARVQAVVLAADAGTKP